MDFLHVGGPVHLLLDGELIQNIDQIKLSYLGDDYVSVSKILGYDFIDGRLGTNTFSIKDGPDGVFVASQPSFLKPGYRLEPTDGLGALRLQNFEVFELTDAGDEADFRLFEENGDEITGGFRITAYTANGHDTLTGSAAHDDLHGGEGDDTIKGGEGADYIYDNGAEASYREGESFDAYVNRLLAYDTYGNDTIEGGAGSDVIVHSGGTDVVEGGAGADIYLTIDEVRGNLNPQDDLTIILREDAGDSSTWFGNDLILGDGRGVDLVRFQGIDSSDVTVSYQYDEIFLGSEVVEFNAQFWWNWDIKPQTVDYYQTVGAYEIRVNATGSSIVVENVIGYHARGDNPSGLVQIEASMSVPFKVEFDDGLMSWPDRVLDNANGNYTFANSSLGPNAFAARGALGKERGVPEADINGTADDDDLYGNSSSDRISGSEGDDRIFAGGGDDLIVGGLGADIIDGGDGIDTASYENASGDVGISLSDTSFQAGEAVGDSLSNVENLRGSAFNDLLSGNSERNFIWGGSGDDEIYGGGGVDELHGGDGDDELVASYWHDDRLYGDAGNDTLRGGGGDDFLFGGSGDDLLISNFLPSAYDDFTPGNDHFDGGEGIDTAEFWYEGNLVVDLEAGKAELGDVGEVVTLHSIENASGGRSDDVLIGNAVDNVLRGDQGNDLLVGGDGNDTLFGNDGADTLYGGTGIDTARILGATQAMASYTLVDGGVVVSIDTSHPDALWNTDGGTFAIYDDVEFIEFDDGTRTYQEIAGPLQTEFAVIDDFIRVTEATTAALDFTANDIEFQSDPISLVSLNGVAVVPGQMQRLDNGATLTVQADGTVVFDQGGAYAWLDAGETVTETFTYTATDSTGIERSGNSTVIIDGATSASGSLQLDRNAFIANSNPNAADALRIANFDLARAVLIVDQEHVDPNSVLPGVQIQEIDGDTYVTFGGDDAVILEDIDLAAWRHAAALQTIGTSGNDALTGTGFDEVFVGGTGNDTINPAGGDDVLLGGAGNDKLWLGGGRNIVFGGEGNDEISNGSGGPHATGNSDDTLYGDAGNDTIRGGSGDDEITGGTGNDSLFGGADNDTLRGGAGDDTLFGGSGQDVFDGGAGFDSIELYLEGSATTGAAVDLSTGRLSWNYVWPTETLISIESVLGTSLADTLLGDEHDNVLAGNAGDDFIRGRDGDDRLLTGSGSSTLYGDAGDDLLYNQSNGGHHLFGGTGNDIFQGYFWGSNVLDGGDGNDTLDLSVSHADIDVDLATGSVGSGASQDTIIGIENVIGTRGANVIWGDAGNNILDGGEGDDDHFGGDGNDLLIANIGADNFDGGNGIDTLDFTYYSGGAVIDLVQELATFPGGTSEDVLTSKMLYWDRATTL